MCPCCCRASGKVTKADVFLSPLIRCIYVFVYRCSSHEAERCRPNILIAQMWWSWKKCRHLNSSGGLQLCRGENMPMLHCNIGEQDTYWLYANQFTTSLAFVTNSVNSTCTVLCCSCSDADKCLRDTSDANTCERNHTIRKGVSDNLGHFISILLSDGFKNLAVRP